MNQKIIIGIWAILLSLAFIFSGCATVDHVTKVTTPKGEIYTVISEEESLVEFRDQEVSLKVDNRENPSFFRAYMEYLLMRAAPTVRVEEVGIHHR